LHTDLQINMEGVAVIAQLLDRMDEMQAKMDRLQNRLNLYEWIILGPLGWRAWPSSFAHWALRGSFGPSFNLN